MLDLTLNILELWVLWCAEWVPMSDMAVTETDGRKATDSIFCMNKLTEYECFSIVSIGPSQILILPRTPSQAPWVTLCHLLSDLKDETTVI
jgi:hypothetical protein